MAVFVIDGNEIEGRDVYVKSGTASFGFCSRNEFGRKVVQKIRVEGFDTPSVIPIASASAFQGFR